MLRNDVKFYVERFDGTADIFRVMMHELGHMSHILEAGVNFQLSYTRDPMLVESWAECTEYYFTLQYYPTRTLLAIPERRESLINRGGKSWQYTPFFIDLADTQNQRNVLPSGGRSNEYSDDRVERYTLSQMLNALDRRTTLKGVEEYLINNLNNSTENNISRMRDFYENIKDNKRK